MLQPYSAQGELIYKFQVHGVGGVGGGGGGVGVGGWWCQGRPGPVYPNPKLTISIPIVCNVNSVCRTVVFGFKH